MNFQRQYDEVIYNLVQVTNTYFGPLDLSEQFSFVNANGERVVLPHIRYHFNLYEHTSVAHTFEEIWKWGSVANLSSWVCELLNKYWKRIFAESVTHNTGKTELHDVNISGQGLAQMIQLLAPKTRSGSKVDERVRGPYKCNKCGELLFDGHSKSCSKRKSRLDADAEVCETLTFPVILGLWTPGKEWVHEQPLELDGLSKEKRKTVTAYGWHFGAERNAAKRSLAQELPSTGVGRLWEGWKTQNSCWTFWGEEDEEGISTPDEEI